MFSRQPHEAMTATLAPEITAALAAAGITLPTLVETIETRHKDHYNGVRCYKTQVFSDGSRVRFWYDANGQLAYIR